MCCGTSPSPASHWASTFGYSEGGPGAGTNDRLGRERSYMTSTSSSIWRLPRMAFEIGHFDSASVAACVNASLSRPVTFSATTCSREVVSLIPVSPLSAVTVAVITVRPAAPPLRPTVAFSAIAKHAACEPASNSSGLVVPAGSPMREGNVTGRLNAPLPAFATPLPSMMGPDQSTVTDLENVAILYVSYFFPFAVTNNCTSTPALPSTSAATASIDVAGSGLSGYTL